MLRGVRAVDLGEQVEIATLTLGAYSDGWREIENRRAFRTERRALKAGGQVAIAPVRRAALRIADFREDDESGQVLVQSAKAVVHP